MEEASTEEDQLEDPEGRLHLIPGKKKAAPGKIQKSDKISLTSVCVYNRTKIKK